MAERILCEGRTEGGEDCTGEEILQWRGKLDGLGGFYYGNMKEGERSLQTGVKGGFFRIWFEKKGNDSREG